MRHVSHDIIVRPIITEKTNKLMSMNKYTFEVLPDANKIDIRHAIEEVFKVKVADVHTINIHSKPKRLGRYLGRTRSWKKAIVTLRQGERIEFFEGAGL